VGAVAVLEAGAAEDPVARERFLRHLRRESERLVRLVRSLLLLARATAGTHARTSSIDLRPVLERVAGQLALQDDVRLDVQCDRGLRARSHPDLVESALLNLAENAVKHTVRGRVILSGRETARGVVLEVADTGSGMNAEETERAPERFYRGSDRGGDGFGLGLSIVRQIADVLSAQFELESRPGEGTVARLLLPRDHA
jgi:two-component system phosphate regulon sensor histidine kinase PhoR